MSRYATTAVLIEDVKRVQAAKRITPQDAARLEQDLRQGLIVHPIWEDYGLQTGPDGRPR